MFPRMPYSSVNSIIGSKDISSAKLGDSVSGDKVL